MKRFTSNVFRPAVIAGLLGILVCTSCQNDNLGGPIEGELMVVNFQPQQTLRYRFTSERTISIELRDPSQEKQDKKTMTESLDLILSATPQEVDPFGLTTIEFTCESAKVNRSSFTGRRSQPDAMESLRGKTYRLVITPTGQIENREDYQALLEEIGKKAFVQSTKPNMRVKNPDMIFDWIYFHLYLWDAPTSIQNPLQGVSVGSQWQSKQVLPWPIAIPNMPTRTVTYRLEQVDQQDTQRIAVLESSYELSPELQLDFPRPYEGRFQVKGSLFSVLHSYRFQSLEGKGTQKFNLDTGILQSDQQEYTLSAQASFIFPLGNSVPYLTIQQKFRTELLDDSQ